MLRVIELPLFSCHFQGFLAVEVVLGLLQLVVDVGAHLAAHGAHALAHQVFHLLLSLGRLETLVLLKLLLLVIIV